MKTFFSLAVLASIATTPALAERLIRDGITYDYTVKAIGENQLISGTDLSTGKSFRLLVKGAKVTGSYGESQVRFKRTPAKVAANGGGTVLAAK